MESISTALKALGHPDRLRILALLGRGELTVSEMVQILGLSQPRVTQYIKSLESAGLLERLKEGSWVFSRLRRSDDSIYRVLSKVLEELPSDDPVLSVDFRRLEDVRQARAELAESVFASVANNEGQLGYEYVPHDQVEAAMLSIIGDQQFEHMVDLGTGTGRLLAVFHDRIKRGSGIDNSSDMLRVARHNLAKPDYKHLDVQHGDLHSSPIHAGSADLVTIHQVLHYLDDPAEAIREASRLLELRGKLLIVDFEAHNEEHFRHEFAHRRLGFSDDDISSVMRNMGLDLLSVKTVETGQDGPQIKLWLGDKLKQAI